MKTTARSSPALLQTGQRTVSIRLGSASQRRDAADRLCALEVWRVLIQ
jgi:hypothetical protein